jgi:asparagine synthase (glutamine-hydrolysing)
MMAALRHRGPDDEGYLLVESASGRAQACGGSDTVAATRLPFLPAEPPPWSDLALGNRRLAIIDRGPAGHQPMAFSDARLWVTYNGEIFNYVELREELKSLGQVFRTASDTEVLLAAYAQWGAEALPRFNGMWAFALYDATAEAPFLRP